MPMMGRNEFEKGMKFSLNDSIGYADKAVVSKQVLKKETGNISLPGWIMMDRSYCVQNDINLQRQEIMASSP